MDPWPAALIRFGILVALSAPFSLLLRRGGFVGGRPGAAIFAGLVAGVLAGPLVLGRAQPALHQDLAVGASEERSRVAELRRRHEAEVLAMLETGVSEVAIDERRAEQERELAPLLADRLAAREAHDLPQRMVATGLVGVAFFAGSAVARRRRPTPETIPEVVPAIAAGVCGALTALLVHAALAVWLLGARRDVSFAIGAAFAAGSLAPHLATRWVAWEGRNIPATALMAFMFLVSLVALFVAAGEPESSWMLPPMVALVLGMFARGEWSSRRGVRNAARGALLVVAVAPLAGWAASLADPRLVLGSWRALAFVVVAVLLAGSGQLLGVYLALKFLGSARQRARALRVGIESMALGLSLTQVLLLALLLASEVLDAGSATGAAVVWGLLLAALSFEATLGLTRRLLRVEEGLEAEED